MSRRHPPIPPGRAHAPSPFDSLLRAGIAAAQQGQSAQALELCERALALRPDSAEALNGRGGALADLGRHAEALECFDRALALRPDYVEALNNRGNAFMALGRFAEALEALDRALSINPSNGVVMNNRGAVLNALRRHVEALACVDQALEMAPAFAEAHANRGVALASLLERKRALESFDRALQLKPDLLSALQARASTLAALGRHAEAIRDLGRVIERAPGLRNAEGTLLGSRMACCEWDTVDDLIRRVVEGVRAGRPTCVPFTFLAISDSPADQLACARTWVREECPPAPVSLWTGERYRHDRIRLAYVSPDFREHAVASLVVGLLEAHDRSRFEVTAISLGPATPGPMRARIRKAFDTFIDVRRMDDLAAASQIRKREIDIAVDLGGFTRDSRTGILARRPAPIQVNFLGYPGTMGAPYIDYVLADEVVAPPAEANSFTEKLIYLPDTYQPNDSRRPIAERTPTRAECGLPEHGFVFCSFNNSYKITPAIFDVWTRLLRRVDGSVLWLLGGNGEIPQNLRREAARRGISPDRLVFASRLASSADHLARHRLADLFLDTLPYNAHTTASDALWAGLPVLTCTGSTFAGRVATSLLNAVGLPELVTTSLADYEALAFGLTTDTDALAVLKSKLARQRTGAPLFDTDRFRRHIEAAYVGMWERQQRGEPPAGFAVPPIATGVCA